jgi:hypothetical protein
MSKIVISVNTPECALCAFVKILDDTFEKLVCEPSKIKDVDLTLYDDYEQVIIIGDYFEEPRIKSHHHVIVSETDLFEQVLTVIPRMPLRNLFIQYIEDMIPLINNKIFSRESLETQIFFCGIYNMTEGNTLYDKFLSVLMGKTKFAELMTTGKNILTSQIGIAKDRCLKNSRQGTLKNTVTYCVTNAPELMNLTHEQLHEKYPDVSVTILTRFKYKEGVPDTVGHSLRSWSSDIDVRDIIGEFGGGITSQVAGGTTPIDDVIVY